MSRVTVIGAGIAGLAAASRLLKAGFQDVVILEASSRVGGRIHSVNFKGNEIEMGAQWIHGEKDNELYDMALELGITDDPDNPVLEDLGEDFVDDEGNVWDDDLVDRMWEIAETAEEEEDEYEYDVSFAPIYEYVIDPGNELDNEIFTVSLRNPQNQWRAISTSNLLS